MYEEVEADFEKLADCHKHILLEAANNISEAIWINMSNLYGFRGREEVLRNYCFKYIRTHPDIKLST